MQRKCFVVLGRVRRSTGMIMKLAAHSFRIGLLSLWCAAQSRAQTIQAIYDDALQNGWQNWSWASVSLSNTNPVHAGTQSISVTAGAWQALYFEHAAFDPASFTNLTFWIHGGSSGGQQLQVQAVSGGSAVASGQSLAPLAANSWQQINIPISALVPSGQSTIDGFWLQDRSGTAQPVFYVDDISLVAGPTPPPTTNSTVTIRVDAGANRHLISPEIYGVAFASSNELADLNVPLNRSGGNTTTRYNWQINAANHAADWYFESIGSASATPGADGDDFISQSKAAGAQPMLTIPTIGWVAKLGPSRARLASFSIAKYGPQQARAPDFADAGNGVATNGVNITGNDPNDANLPADSNFQLGWMQHLTNRWGRAAAGGLRYYIMDNEPSIWSSTHRDVHPTGPTMDEIRDKILDYGAKVKSVDPNALVVGPEEWGWSGYFYSGYDQQWGSRNGWNNLPDRAAHGNADYLPWLLDQLRRTNNATRQRPLDLFTVHYYPQGGEFGNDVSTSMQLRRNRSTRSLWDTNYVDETWINDKVRLIPRLKQWATQYYPGTPVGITEYNWGAEDHINGATAQADVLGIFGREALDLATRWTTPASTTPTYKALKMYRNYDGNKSAFGDTSVAVTGPNPDSVAVFAAQRSSDSALTVMVISKYLSGSTPVSIALNNFASAGTAEVYQLTSANAITRLSDLSFGGSTASFTAPAQSITLLVLPPGTPNQQPLAVASATATSRAAPLTVSFSSAGSSDPDGSISSYSWSFGDGTAPSNSPSPSHAYQNAGNYTALLTVTDNGGATGTAQVSITVAPGALVAPTNLTGQAGRGSVTLNWTDNSTNQTG